MHYESKYDIVSTQKNRNIMKLDLAKMNATHLQFDVELLLPDGIVEKLIGCFPEEKKKTPNKERKSTPLFFGEDYKASGKKHYARGVVIKEHGKNKCSIVVGYSTLAPLFGFQYAESFRPISELLACLTNFDKDITFNVNAFFEYSPKKYKFSFLDLPISVESKDFDEIRGIRFSKTQKGKVIYSVVMDSPMNKEIFNGVTFQYKGIFSNDLPEKVLKYADQISRRLIAEL